MGSETWAAGPDGWRLPIHSPGRPPAYTHITVSLIGLTIGVELQQHGSEASTFILLLSARTTCSVPATLTFVWNHWNHELI